MIGSIIDYLFAPDDPEAVIEKMASADIRIVSLTITEGGYNSHHLTGEFNADNPDVIHDLTPGTALKTTFGLITEALSRRRARGLAPFPNSMVDRITPATTDADRTAVADEFGIIDAGPVVCEPFEQWVLEDHFSMGRPPFDRAGVQLVEDVEPYELMKLRLLNASHQGMCYFGYLAGYRYAHEAAQYPVFTQFLLDYMDKEATPTLQPVPGINLAAYKRTLIERFFNEYVRDTLARLCAESSGRIPKWLLPVIKENLDKGGDIHRSAAIVASWARYAEGNDEQGNHIDVVDRLKEPMMAAAALQHDNPLAFVSNPDIFGDLKTTHGLLRRTHRPPGTSTREAPGLL